MAKIGRPTDYNAKTAEKICDLTAVGWTVRQICALEDMPSHTALYDWLKRHDEFAEQYARARERQASFFAEEILEIADDSTNDWVERENKAGRLEKAPDHDHINRSRLRIDTRKWLASKYLPKVFGDRQQLEHSGGDQPVKIVVERVEAPLRGDDD